MLPMEVFAPLSASYVLLKVFEDFFLDGVRLLPVYGNILFKVLPIVALLIWLLAADTVAERFHMFAGFALVFSMGGDVLLELNHLKHHFVLGLGSFFIAHIFYCVTFWNRPPKASIVNVLGSAAVAAAIVYLGGLFASTAPPDLALPVVLYCGVIGTMVVFSILLSDVPNRRNAIAGAIIFALSDSTIATEKFLVGVPVAGARAFIMLTYYLAQYLLVSGFVSDEEDDEDYYDERKGPYQD